MSFYEYDNSTSQECNDIFRDLEGGTFTKLAWGLIKPYIRGKILYTPDTPATQKLMKMVNDSFQPIARLREFSLLWLDNKDRIRGFLMDSENREFIEVSILKL